MNFPIFFSDFINKYDNMALEKINIMVPKKRNSGVVTLKKVNGRIRKYVLKKITLIIIYLSDTIMTLKW